MEILATITSLTCTYALLAAGIVILYKGTRVVNFAHGELAVVGGYVFYSWGFAAGDGSIINAVSAAIVFSIASGVFVYFVLMRRVLGEPFYVPVLLTVGIGIVLKAAIIVVWQAQHVTIDIGVASVVRMAGGAVLTWMDIINVTLTAGFFCSLYLFLQFTRLGRQFRGTAENPLLASQRGVSINVVLSLAWIIAMFAASLSGVLYGARAFLSVESITIGLSGLTAAIVGGLDSLRGAVIGAIIVATAQYVTVRLVDPILAEALPLIILLIVLNVRPWGLFGTLEELRRV